ncbi:MAG: molybdopterin-dependent oxidoreductase, partial [Caulobacterales bacterium]|nr:molybdopterin-dependent oxidoreductase [Caulobacterales bacterium]
KPYAFNARPWELTVTETVDVMDALGSHIRVDARGPAVLRILPRVNEEINEEGISDKTRFVWDGLARQRLDRPYVRQAGELRPASWGEALDAVARRLTGDPERIAAIAGDLCDAESMKALMDLMCSLGVRDIDCRQDGAKLGGGPRESWLFNSTLYGVEDADAILLVGTNPRIEAPVLNARIRKTVLAGGLRVGLIGEPADLTYDVSHIGAGPETLAELASGQGAAFKALAEASRPMVIVGQGALARPDGAAVLRLAGRLAAMTPMLQAPSESAPEGWNGFNVLHTAAARVAGLDMGFLPAEGARDVAGILEAAGAGAMDTVVLLGADEIDASALGSAFVVYIGHHGDRGAHRADVVLPGAAYTEKNGMYVNTEGRVQLARRAVFPKGEAREDWAILRALSDRVGRTLPYDDHDALRARLIADHPTFGAVDYAAGGASAGALDLAAIGADGPLEAAPFRSPIENFYFTNAIARASATMAEASAAVAAARGQLQAAE